MAVIDPDRDAVVIRVVYDGPPMAGKTTSVRALAKGVGGELTVPEEIGGRTLYFDWLDYTGGLFEGRRIRCQIISVPGQATLASRRRRLLETADVVVFVGDSTMADQSAAASYLEGLRRVLARVEGPPVGIVLQANKRDRPDAVPLHVVRAMLDAVGGRIGLVESVAIDGSGVREAFVFAVRLALDRVRELMRTNRLRTAPPEVDSAQELLDELRRVEGSTLDLAAESALAHTPMRDLREAAPAAEALQQAIHENLPATEKPSVWSTPASASTGGNIGDASSSESDVAPAVPQRDLPSGMIWPPVHGRLILHGATATSIALKRQPNGDWTGTAGSHWHLHSPAGARFTDLEVGREALVNWARLHAASAHVISSERCVVLSEDGSGHYRLWQIVRIEPSLRDEFNMALRGGPAMIARGLLTMTRAFLLAAERFASAACWLPLSLRNVGAPDNGTCFLGHMPHPQSARAPTARTQAATLKLLSVQLEYALPEVEVCRSEVLAELERLISSEDVASPDVTQVFARRFLSSAAT